MLTHLDGATPRAVPSLWLGRRKNLGVMYCAPVAGSRWPGRCAFSQNSLGCAIRGYDCSGGRDLELGLVWCPVSRDETEPRLKRCRNSAVNRTGSTGLH